MKYIITLTLFLFANMITSALAQKLIVSDTTIQHDGLERACIIVLMDPDVKTIKGQVQNWLRSEHKVRLKGFGFLANADVLTAEKVRLSRISAKQMDFFVRVLQRGDYSEMCVFASLGYNIHITPEDYPSEYGEMKKLVFDFLDDFLPSWYQEQIEETQKLIEDLQKEQSKLTANIARNDKEIEKLTKQNNGMHEELGKIKTGLQKNAEILGTQKEKLSGIHSNLEINKRKNN